MFIPIFFYFTEKIMSTIKENGVFHGLMYTLFLNLSAQLTKELGMAPGGEFRRALAEVSLGLRMSSVSQKNPYTQSATNFPE